MDIIAHISESHSHAPPFSLCSQELVFEYPNGSVVSFSQHLIPDGMTTITPPQCDEVLHGKEDAAFLISPENWRVAHKKADMLFPLTACISSTLALAHTFSLLVPLRRTAGTDEKQRGAQEGRSGRS